MSKEKYNEIIQNIDSDKYHLYFAGDKEDFLLDLELMWLKNEITGEEYDDILNYIESKTCGIPDCIWDAMCECNPDLKD